MGIDYEGGMIVGADGDLLSVPDGVKEPFYEWAEDVGLERMSRYYDAGQEECYYGFTVPDVFVSEILSSGWLRDVSDKAAEFEKLTGVKAQLIGSQDIT